MPSSQTSENTADHFAPDTPSPPSSQLNALASSSQLPTPALQSPLPIDVAQSQDTGSSSDSAALTPAASSLFTSVVLTNDLLYDLVLWCASPATLVRLARTCRSAHAAVQSHIRRTYNINAHLSRFFAAPLAFRSLQARTHTLISGSNTLQFLDRTYWPESDLDLYCHYEAREELGWYLIREEGYRFVPNSRQDPSFSIAVTQARPEGIGQSAYSRLKGVAAIYTFAKRVQNPEGPSRRLKVQIIVTCNTPMEAIFNFHSSMSSPPPHHVLYTYVTAQLWS